jgi:hypothetical protein
MTPSPNLSGMARKRRARPTSRDQRIRLQLDVLHAYQRHYGTTTQREDAARELGMDLETFRGLLAGARLSGFDIEAAPGGLSSHGRPVFLPDGSLRAPDGVIYRQTPERVSRTSGRDLVTAGAPVATNVYPEGLSWHADKDAAAAWAEIEGRLVVGRPSPVQDLQWVGHVWQSEDGEALLYFEGRH